MGTKAVFVVIVSTVRMLFPGIPPAVDLPGGEPSTVVPATRSVALSLYSDREAGPKASVHVRVPAGLGVGEQVTLEIDRPQPRAEIPQTESKPVRKITTKTFWGCADTVPDGQPRRDNPPKAASTASDVPNVTCASWPGPRQEPLSETAQAQGSYTLITNFTGSAAVTIAPEQEFLAPIEISDTDKIKLGQPIRLKWGKVPRALAYLVTGLGGTENESVTWTSSADPDAVQGIEERVISEGELKDLIEKGVLLGPETVSCTIPATVFAGARGAMITVTAFGRDKIQTRAGIESRALVRSSASVAVMRESASR